MKSFGGRRCSWLCRENVEKKAYIKRDQEQVGHSKSKGSWQVARWREVVERPRHPLEWLAVSAGR